MNNQVGNEERGALDASTFVQELPALMAALRNIAVDKKAAADALRHLRAQFVELLHTDILHDQVVKDTPEGAVVSYLVEQYRTFQTLLLSVFKQQSNVQLSMATWHAVMDCVRAERVGSFNQHFFNQSTHAFLTSKKTKIETVERFAAKYIKHWDVRFCWLQQIQKAAAAMLEGSIREVWQEPSPAETLLAALCAVDAAIGDEPLSWCGGVEAGVLSTAPMRREGVKARQKRKRSETAEADMADGTAAKRALWASVHAQAGAYSDSWLSFLRVPMPDGLFKSLLLAVTETVIINIKNPITLSDFLTKATEQGGLVGILALQGLFYLVTQHGLEHPDFYKRLYMLLTPQVFTARYRVKFLQLMDIFLASSMVPAYSAAAFAKKFARLSATAPPLGSLSCLAFIHNLIRRHPSCMCLIHRPSRGDVQLGDPYAADAQDMDESKGIDSCLWELSAARVHLDSTVAAFARRFDLDVTNRKAGAEVDLHSILTGRYKTQVHEALDKKLRRPPAVSYPAPGPCPDPLQLGLLPGCNA